MEKNIITSWCIVYIHYRHVSTYRCTNNFIHKNIYLSNFIFTSKFSHKI